MLNTFSNNDLSNRLSIWFCCDTNISVVDYYLCQHCSNYVVQELATTAPSALNDQMAMQVDSRKIQKAFLGLLPEQRLVIYLKIVAGLSNQDVSEIINRSIGAVKNIQRRALFMLSDLLFPERELVIL